MINKGLNMREAQKRAAQMKGFFRAFEFLEDVLKAAADAPMKVKHLEDKCVSIEESITRLGADKTLLLENIERLNAELGDARVHLAKVTAEAQGMEAKAADAEKVILEQAKTEANELREQVERDRVEHGKRKSQWLESERAARERVEKMNAELEGIKDRILGK